MPFSSKNAVLFPFLGVPEAKFLGFISIKTKIQLLKLHS